jgi:hypothetical protein
MNYFQAKFQTVATMWFAIDKPSPIPLIQSKPSRKNKEIAQMPNVRLLFR